MSALIKDLHLYSIELSQALYADFLTLSSDERVKVLNFLQIDPNEINGFSNLSFSQLWSLELFILKSLDDAEVIRRTWIIREKFRLQLGDEEYKKYQNSLPEALREGSLSSQALTAEDVSILRNDNVNLARQLQRLNYYKIRRNETIKSRKSFAISIMATLLVIGIFFYWVSIPNTPLNNLICQVTSSTVDPCEQQTGTIDANRTSQQNEQLKDTATPNATGQQLEPKTSDKGQNSTVPAPFLLLVVYFGMMGAFISLLQRIESASNAPLKFTDNALDSTDININLSNHYIISLILSGAVFAFLAYLLTISGAIEFLDVIPKPDPESTPLVCDSVKTYQFMAKLTCPQFDYQNTAKLFIICFVSGFAERLVPDVLSNIVNKTKNGHSS